MTAATTGHPQIRQETTIEGDRRQHHDWRCLACNALLMRLALPHGTDIEKKCYQCKAMNRLLVIGERITATVRAQRA